MGITLQCDVLEGNHSCIRFGSGSSTLVILPALSDALFDVTAWGRTLALFYRAYAARFTVYVVSRPRGIRRGVSTRDLASAYLPALKSIGPRVHLMGVSMGGLIAQHVAADHPELVDRLVLGICAHRFSPPGAQLVREMSRLAEAEDWRGLFMRVIETRVVAGRDFLYRRLQAGGHYAVIRAPSHAQDFVASAGATLGHDSTVHLPRIAAPTLVIGGTRDAFFTTDLFRETASLIPRSRLHLIEGATHGAIQEHKADFDAAVLGFLTESL